MNAPSTEEQIDTFWQTAFLEDIKVHGSLYAHVYGVSEKEFMSDPLKFYKMNVPKETTQKQTKITKHEKLYLKAEKVPDRPLLVASRARPGLF